MTTRRTVLAAGIAALTARLVGGNAEAAATRPPDGLVFCPDCQPEILAGFDYYTRDTAPWGADVFVGDAKVDFAYAAVPGDADHGWYLTHAEESVDAGWPAGFIATCNEHVVYPFISGKPSTFGGVMMRVVHADVIVSGVGEAV